MTGQNYLSDVRFAQIRPSDGSVQAAGITVPTCLPALRRSLPVLPSTAICICSADVFDDNTCANKALVSSYKRKHPYGYRSSSDFGTADHYQTNAKYWWGALRVFKLYIMTVSRISKTEGCYSTGPPTWHIADNIRLPVLIAVNRLPASSTTANTNCLTFSSNSLKFNNGTRTASHYRR